MELRESIGDPLGQESPRARATVHQAQHVEDDPEAVGGASFSGAASFEQEPKLSPAASGSVSWMGASSRDNDNAWSSSNPIAGAASQPQRATTSLGSVGTGTDAHGFIHRRDRFDLRSQSMGSLGSDTQDLASVSSGTGVSPTFGRDQTRQNPNFGAALDRLVVQRQRGGLTRHLRGVGPGNYLESSLVGQDGEVSPRGLGIGDLARAASNSNGLAWRSGSRPQDTLTATEVLAAQYEAGLARGDIDVEEGEGGRTSALDGTEQTATMEDGRRSVRWAGDMPSGGGGLPGYRSGMSDIGENCLVILTIVTLACVLYVLQQVLVPLVLAVFVSAMLLPMLDFVTERPFHLFGRVWLRNTCGLCLAVERRYDNWLGHLVTSLLTLRLPNVIGLLVVLGALVVLGFGLSLLVYSSVETFWSKSDYYEQEVFNLTSSMPTWVITHVGSSGKVALSKDKLFGTLTDSAAASEILLDILMESEHVLTSLALTFLYSIFILLGRQDRTVREANRTLVMIEDQLQVYLSWKFVVSAVSGSVIGVTLSQLRIDLAAVFGLLTFFLNFIPTVGLLVAVVLPMPLIYISPVPASNKFFAVVIPYGIQVLVTNFVEPLVFGRRLHLHPIFVLFSLVFWNMLWGLTGAVLSIPIM